MWEDETRIGAVVNTRRDAVAVTGRGSPSAEARTAQKHNTTQQRPNSQQPSGLVLTIYRAPTGGCFSEDAALPREEDPEAVQAPAAAGTAHLGGLVHLPAHQPGQDYQTTLQLRKR